MTTFLMYLLTKLDELSKIANIIAFITCIVVVVFTIIQIVGAFESNDPYSGKDNRRAVKISRRIKKPFVVAFIISTTLATLLPTTKQAAFIWVAPQIIENGAVKDTVASIPELTKLGTEYLKQMLKDEINDNKNSTTAGESN